MGTYHSVVTFQLRADPDRVNVNLKATKNSILDRN
jgi:hypothetical protein